MSDVTTTRQNRIRDVAWYWLPPLIWMGIIFFLSAQPKLPSPPSPWLDTLLKKGAHFGAYGMLVFWWWRALSAGAVANRVALGLAFAVSVLYGISDEFHQSFVPGRSPSLVDVLIDATGAAVGVGVIWQWRTRR